MRETDAMLVWRSVPVIRDMLSICRLICSNGLPVSPRRVFRSATALPMSSKDDGVFLPMLSADWFSPSSALPDAPVPTTIVSDMSSNVEPTLSSAAPAATVSAIAALETLANAAEVLEDA